MNKTELRKIYIEKRIQLLPEDVEAGSKKICDLLFQQFQFEKISSVHIFLPIERKNELNTFYIIKKLQEYYPSVKISVPKMVEGDIQSFLLTPELKIEKNAFGVPEPVNGSPLDHQQVEFVLLPLLAFDKKGNRIGYGKGFYDRFLITCRENVVKVGLSLFEPEEEIDADPFDVPLDFCITPEKVYTFRD